MKNKIFNFFVSFLIANILSYCMLGIALGIAQIPRACEIQETNFKEVLISDTNSLVKTIVIIATPAQFSILYLTKKIKGCV